MAPHPESARHTRLKSLNQEFSGEVVTHPRSWRKKLTLSSQEESQAKNGILAHLLVVTLVTWDSLDTPEGYMLRICSSRTLLNKCWCRVVSWAPAQAK